MVEASWVESEVLKAVPNAIVEVIDLHGSGDHFHVRIITEDFEGVRPLQRQKQVLAVMKQHIPPYPRLRFEVHDAEAGGDCRRYCIRPAWWWTRRSHQTDNEE